MSKSPLAETPGLAPSSGRWLWSLDLGELPGEEKDLHAYSATSALGGTLVLGTMSRSLLGFSFPGED